MNKIIEVKELCKTYYNPQYSLKVLNNVNLDIYEGEIAFIIGPSGAGKTTLLNILGLMDSFDSGIYNLFGKNVNTLSFKERNFYLRNEIGFLFQNVPLLKELNVYENILLPFRIKNTKNSSVKNSLIEICEKLGIAELVSRKITQISAGQRQRVALASILLKGAKILLCDEPTANLDNENTLKLMELIQECNRTYNLTIIFTTHNVSLAKFATKIYSINFGKVTLQDNCN
jgi:ABC-type lipoprotein export system ATPase subunit